MTQAINEQLKQTCQRKKAFATEREALTFGHEFNRDFSKQTEWTAYKCQHCFRWHLSSE